MDHTPRKDAWLHAILHTGNPGDVAFYRDACAGVRSVLELGCGGGRIAIELARAGHEVTGVELHRGLLGRLRQALAKESAEVRRRVHPIHADLRRLELGRRFDRVIAPYNVLYCLLEEEELREALAGVREHLEPGGRFVFDVYCPARIDPAEQARLASYASMAARRHHVVSFEAEGARVDVFESDNWDHARQRIDVTYHYTIRRGEQVEQASQTICQRYVYPEQLERLLGEAGLALERRWGDFDGGPFDPEDGLFVGIARHAPEGRP